MRPSPWVLTRSPLGCSLFGWQRKLVKLSKHDPDSDVWEGDEWAESLELLLEQGMLPPGMPQEGF